MNAPQPQPVTNILDIPFPDIFDEWERRTNNYKDIRMVRGLAMWDRYFLLVQLCGRKDMLHPWIYARCREVERDPDGYLDLWARYHYKSTIVTFGGCIQEILRDREITIGIFSNTKAIAIPFLRQIQQELENNENLKKLFPDVLYADPVKQSPMWSADGGIVVIRKGNPKEATVEACGLIQGMPTSKHYKLRVYDDAVVRESVNTPDQIAKTTEMWELSANLGTSDGRKWGIGTRYSYADSYDAIMKRGSLKARLHPATDDGTITGNPVLLTVEEWAQVLIDQSPPTLSTQMLQDPLSAQQRMFDVEDLRYYEIRPSTINVYILCDPARSNKKDSDNSAFVVIGLDSQNNKYLLDGYNHRMDLMGRWTCLSNLYLRWKRAPGVQNLYVGYESFGAQADLDYFKEQQRKNLGLMFPIAEVAWPREGPGSKVDRVQRLGPDFRAHKIFLPFELEIPAQEQGELNPKRMQFTANQVKMINSGYDYRVARPIRRKDSEGKIYDLTAQFKLQAHFFPFGGKKDLVDAASRIYDMNPKAPTLNEPGYAEPEFA